MSCALISMAACGDESPERLETKPDPVEVIDAGWVLDAEIEPERDAGANDAGSLDANVAVDAAPATDGSEAEVEAAPTTEITYWRHIQPLIEEHCIVCHGTTLVGGFSMRTYAEAFQEASGMLAATEARDMPPCEGAAEGTCSLSAAEVALLRSWVMQGRPEGTMP